jgi:hypothetical protein
LCLKEAKESREEKWVILLFSKQCVLGLMLSYFQLFYLNFITSTYSWGFCNFTKSLNIPLNFMFWLLKPFSTQVQF